MISRDRYYRIPDVCVQCGKPIYEVGLSWSIDHLYPKCVLGLKEERRRDLIAEHERHPLWDVIYSTANCFGMCRKEHEVLDLKKTQAFLGTDLSKLSLPFTQRGDPEALVAYLMNNYPITTDVRYFRRQIRAMVTINRAMFQRIDNLNGELDQSLKDKYIEAGKLILDFNKKLRALPCPPVYPPVYR